MKKKILSLVLTVCMLSAFAPIVVSAVTRGTCGDNVTWILDNEGTLTIRGTGRMDDYSRSYDVPWYNNRSSITSVVISDSVTSVGSNAFENSGNLTSIKIPDSVTSIGYSAFRGCSSLVDISIPDSIASIGNGAFIGTSYYENESNWINGVLYINNHLIKSNQNIIGKYVIRDGTVTISDYAFQRCNFLTEVELPDSIMFIGDGVFELCSSLTSVSMPNSVTSIGSGAFYDCNSLTSVSLSDNITSIGSGAFYGCGSLISISLPDTVTSIAYGTFSECSLLTSVSIPNSVTSIGEYAFRGCSSLTSIILPDSVSYISYWAFQDCSSLEDISLPDNVMYIENHAFDGTAYYKNESNWINDVLYIDNKLIKAKEELADEYVIKNGTITISSGAFENCGSLTGISMPNSVKSIDRDAFENCSSLKSIIIPDGVSSIGDHAFYGCSSLESITLPDSVSSIGGDAFYGTSYYENESNRINGALYIGNHLVDVNNKLINEYIIKNGTMTIGNSAFYGCSSLTSINIPDSVIYIGDYAFSGCRSLTDISIPKGVTRIGNFTFYNCSSVITMNISASISYIGADAFSGCVSLTTINIPASVSSIGYGAFSICNNLSDIYYGGTELEWDKVSIDSHNAPLTNAIIHYNASGIPSVTLISVKKENNEYTATANLSHIPESSVLLAALYSNGKMTGCGFVPVTLADTEKSMSIVANEADMIRVFIWDGVNGMKPLCGSGEITIE